MPIVCVRRPNRTVPRKWTEKDLARVALHLNQKRGVSMWAIVGVIIGTLGGGVAFCHAVSALTNITGLVSVLRSLLAALAVGLAVERIASAIVFFKQLTQWPWVRFALFVLVVIYGAMDAIERLLNGLVEDLELVIIVLAGLQEACLAVRKVENLVIDRVQEAVYEPGKEALNEVIEAIRRGEIGDGG